jgi:hypothetical protein
MAAARRHVFSRNAEELARVAADHRLCIAGAGATKAAAARMGAAQLASDPVTAAVELAGENRTGPH